MSVTTYNVDAGKDRATIELSGETKVVFSFDPNIIAVEAVSGSVNVSLDEGATAGDDGCDTLSEGQSTRMNPIADKCIYVNGTGTVKVWGGRSGEDCPFSKGGKGGGSGGGYSETVLYDNTDESETLYPDTITLSDSVYNYDEIYVLFGRDGWCIEQSYKVSAFSKFNNVYFVGVYSFADNRAIYELSANDELSKNLVVGSDFPITLVLGIKYGSNERSSADKNSDSSRA